MRVATHFTSDAGEAQARTRAFLESDPLRHNVLCTLLAGRHSSGTPIRFWWATVGDEVRGVVFQSPETFPAVVSRLDDAVVEPLAQAAAEVTDPPLSGVNGLADDSARFAGAYATVTRRAAQPVEGQRIYQIREVKRPLGVAGGPRPGDESDRNVVQAWVRAFGVDTGLGDGGDGEVQERTAYFLSSRRLWLWQADGAAKASAFASPAAAGVVRVGFVYTPPADRRQGYAAALVADVSQRSLDEGDRCILYTQLSNPTSNAIYQRIGYRPIGELVRYQFGAGPGSMPA